MRKDVKLGLAVGGILFSAVMVYVLFFANGTKPSAEQARGTSASSADAGKVDAAGSQAAHDTSPEHPLTALLPGNVTPATQPTEPTPAEPTVSISGPATRPATDDAAPKPDNAIASVQSGTFNWRAALERGSNAALSHSVTPENPMTSADRGSSAPAPVVDVVPNTSPSTGARTYVVKAGDTLWAIAKAEYGSASYYPHLARANPRAASRLRVGMKIVLPAKDEVVPESAKAVLVTPKVLDATRQYRVQAGDNLYVICKRLYGKTDLVTKLYELNKDLIGPNRSALKPNMVLQLPEPPASNTTVNGGSSSADTEHTDTLAATMQ
jgi:nucleoid-associated protein YgaU